MRFTTESGSTYELTEINEQNVGFDAYLVRDGVPLINLDTGGEMGELYAQRIYFAALPRVGARFHYYSKSHAGCISTPVANIEEEPADVVGSG